MSMLIAAMGRPLIRSRWTGWWSCRTSTSTWPWNSYSGRALQRSEILILHRLSIIECWNQRKYVVSNSIFIRCLSEITSTYKTRLIKKHMIGLYPHIGIIGYQVHMMQGMSIYRELSQECMRCNMRRKRFFEVKMGGVKHEQLIVAPQAYLL